MSETGPRPPGDEIAHAQDQLARALGRARIGEDRNLANQVRELGERLAHLLAGLLRMGRLHSADNTAFDKPVEELRRGLVQLQELLGSTHLVAVEDQVYVNEIRIRAGDKATAIRDLSAELQRHNVGGITFHAPLDGAGVRALVAALDGPPAPAEPRTALARTLATAGLTQIELQGRFRFRMAGESAQQQERKAPRDLVGRALAAVGEELQNLAAGRVPNPLPLRRVVSEMLEGGLAAPELWADVADASPFALHQLRVAQLALLLAQAIELPPSVAQDLGVAGLYHDCGYAAAPSGETPASLAAHGIDGARLLLRQKGYHEAKTRRLLAVLQHHRDADAKPRPGLFARILRIAEDYETLVQRGRRAAPTYALAAMLKWSGSRYDPVLLQLFVNTLGAYPPGTLLRLADGRVVRSAAPALTREAFAHPRALCVRLADGSPAPPDHPPLDLGGTGPLEILPPGA